MNSYRRRLRIHLLLFVFTIFSTFLVGSFQSYRDGIWYSAGIMTILLMHEMGHFLMARRYGVPTSLPYFIPFPISMFGTLGAVIKMEGRIPNRRVLFDIGVAGPLAGMIIIVPAIVMGVKMSSIVDLASLGDTAISLGDSLLFRLLAHWSIDPLPEGKDLLLHPLAYAGWVGLFVTALNLLPVGQLDGGHILYALFWKKGKVISMVLYTLFILIFLFYFWGWILMVVLLAIFRKHPPTIDDSVPLDIKRKVIGIFALIIFFISFTPRPIGLGSGFIPTLFKLVEPWLKNVLPI